MDFTSWIIYLLIIMLFTWFISRACLPVKGNSYEFRYFKSRGEQFCAEILEELLQRQVRINYRPEFLKNPKTNRCLELDAYDEQTKVAIEYNGEQHYVFPNCYHKTRKDFDGQLERDILKEKLCRENNIRLISVPYTVDYKAKTLEKRKTLLRNYIHNKIKLMLN